MPDEISDIVAAKRSDLVSTRRYFHLIPELGFEEKETIATGTRAAAKGGFTTICAMPNTNPVADSPATIEYILHKSKYPSLNPNHRPICIKVSYIFVDLRK